MYIFTENWKKLEDTANNAKMTIDDVVKLYMHILSKNETYKK